MNERKHIASVILASMTERELTPLDLRLVDRIDLEKKADSMAQVALIFADALIERAKDKYKGDKDA